MNCIIHAPKICQTADGKSRLMAEIDFGGDAKEIWLEVDSKYAEYLCAERADAFLIALLPHAMRAGLDIECKAPISERLKYQIETYLIPSLVKYGCSLHASAIIANTDSVPMQNAGGVGAGVSCGVDSFHILYNYLSPRYSSLKLTHLVLNYVGAFWPGEKGRQQYNVMQEKARQLCAELNMELILIDSNIADAIPCDFIKIHTFRNMFAVYALQKLWKVFFYGSAGVDFQQGFDLQDNDLYDAANYDLLTLDCLSVQNLKIYSEGGAIERMDKMRTIADFDLAQRYLWVCTMGAGSNCNRCFKCYRTLLILDALGALDKFGKVFDIDYYRRNRSWYLQKLYWNHIVGHGDDMLNSVYKQFASEITMKDKITVYMHMAKSKTRSLMRG